ncbi:MAG: OmpA family protein [Saprospiraceae bacterium]|jgi:outer membrane protein OmpA-like peptidoglycan-associated protein|nr:OmpA family protein [Saprospiraceae bacterium]
MRTAAFFVFLLFCVYALVARWYFVCEMRGHCNPASSPQASEEDIRPKTLEVREGDTVLLSGYDHFAFDSASVAPRLNADNTAFLDTLAALMKLDTTRRLTITGLYRPGEKDIRPGGFFENIGIARADRLRRLLMQRGLPERYMSLDQAAGIDSDLREPLRFELYRPSGIPEDYEKVQFVFTNMTFSDANFAYNSDEFKPGDAFVAYADSVKTYLDLHSDKTLTIVGHTDNVGSDKYNLQLGLRRAKNARTYFTDLGVSTKIDVKSMGKTRPAASNDTPEGRQKNRRVNFILE